MRRHALAVAFGFLRQHGDFFLGKRRHFGGQPGDVFARQVDLQMVHAVLDEGACRAADFFRSAAHAAKAELRERHVRQRVVAQRADGGDLLAARQVARAGELARVDGVAQHHVEPGLGGGRADGRGPAHVQVALGHPHAPQHVLFGRHELDGRQRGLVVPREMRVRLGHAGHQKAAPPGDDAGVIGADALGQAGDLHDALALHEHVAQVGVGAGAVEDADVGECGTGHGGLLFFLDQRVA
jgi:hypothetical protein